VNFRLAPPEMSRILADASPTILIFDATYQGHVDSFRKSLPGIKHFIAIGNGPDWALSFASLIDASNVENVNLPEPLDTDIAYLIYTSGTTGAPKGVMITHQAADAAARLIGATFQAGPQDRTLIVMPTFHVGGKNVENATRRAGGCVVLHERFDAGEVLRIVERERITVSLFAPTMIQSLLDHPDSASFDLSSLRAVVYSAAAMPPPLLRRALQRFGSVLLSQYGQTEGMGTVLPAQAHVPNGSAKELRRLNSVGHPLPECSVKVVGDDDEELPCDAPGELCLRGPFIMKGYWNKSAETVDALRGGWLHTGDIATIDEDGYVYLVDRKKDVIISGGENIYSREVENALLEHPDVVDAAVVGRPDTKWGEVVCAFVVLADGAVVQPSELLNHCRQLIGGYKVPKEAIVVAELPRLPTGKVAKTMLRARLRDG